MKLLVKKPCTNDNQRINVAVLKGQRGTRASSVADQTSAKRYTVGVNATKPLYMLFALYEDVTPPPRTMACTTSISFAVNIISRGVVSPPCRASIDVAAATASKVFPSLFLPSFLPAE